MTQIWALRWRLEKQPTDLRRNSRDLGDGTLVFIGTGAPILEQGDETIKPRFTLGLTRLIFQSVAEKYSTSASSRRFSGSNL